MSTTTGDSQDTPHGSHFGKSIFNVRKKNNYSWFVIFYKKILIQVFAMSSLFIIDRQELGERLPKRQSNHFYALEFSLGR